MKHFERAVLWVLVRLGWSIAVAGFLKGDLMRSKVEIWNKRTEQVVRLEDRAI